jgi:hypothetical protein
MVSKKLKEIITTRGRKGTDKHEQVEMLAFLSSVAKGVPQKLEVMSQLVSSLFDLNPNISSYMKVRERPGGGAVCVLRVCVDRSCWYSPLLLMKENQTNSSNYE